jgi:hypothetical protein
LDTSTRSNAAVFMHTTRDFDVPTRKSGAENLSWLESLSHTDFDLDGEKEMDVMGPACMSSNQAAKRSFAS